MDKEFLKHHINADIVILEKEIKEIKWGLKPIAIHLLEEDDFTGGYRVANTLNDMYLLETFISHVKEYLSEGEEI